MEYTESTEHDNDGDRENEDESQMFQIDLGEGDDGEYLPEQMQDGNTEE